MRSPGSGLDPRTGRVSPGAARRPSKMGQCLSARLPFFNQDTRSRNPASLDQGRDLLREAEFDPIESDSA